MPHVPIPSGRPDVPGRAGGAVALVVFLAVWGFLIRHEPVTGLTLGWLPAMFASWAAGLVVTVVLAHRERAHDARAADPADRETQRTTQGAEAP